MKPVLDTSTCNRLNRTKELPSPSANDTTCSSSYGATSIVNRDRSGTIDSEGHNTVTDHSTVTINVHDDDSVPQDDDSEIDPEEHNDDDSVHEQFDPPILAEEQHNDDDDSVQQLDHPGIRMDELQDDDNVQQLDHLEIRLDEQQDDNESIQPQAGPEIRIDEQHVALATPQIVVRSRKRDRSESNLDPLDTYIPFTEEDFHWLKYYLLLDCIATPNDILFGRGACYNEHYGNQEFRRVASLYHEEYMNTSPPNKKIIIQRVIQKMRDDGRRFLQQIVTNDGIVSKVYWIEADITKINTKVCAKLKEIYTPEIGLVRRIRYRHQT